MDCILESRHDPSPSRGRSQLTFFWTAEHRVSFSSLLGRLLTIASKTSKSKCHVCFLSRYTIINPTNSEHPDQAGDKESQEPGPATLLHAHMLSLSLSHTHTHTHIPPGSGHLSRQRGTCDWKSAVHPRNLWVQGLNLTGGSQPLSCPRSVDTALKPYIFNLSHTPTPIPTEHTHTHIFTQTQTHIAFYSLSLVHSALLDPKQWRHIDSNSGLVSLSCGGSSLPSSKRHASCVCKGAYTCA